MGPCLCLSSCEATEKHTPFYQQEMAFLLGPRNEASVPGALRLPTGTEEMRPAWLPQALVLVCCGPVWALRAPGQALEAAGRAGGLLETEGC